MNIRIAAALSLALVASAASTVAQAADFYVGGSLGQSSWKINPDAGESIDKSDTGFKLLVGAQISPNFAVEGGYASLGKLNGTATDGESLLKGDVKNSGLFIDAVGKLPLATDWAAFGKLGLYNSKSKLGGGFTQFQGSNSFTGLRYGAGAEYLVTKTVAVRGEWERSRIKLTGDKHNVDLLSVGVTVGF